MFGGHTSDGTNVQIFRDHGLDPQKWHLKSLGDGIYKLIHASSGKALDVTGGATSDETNVQIWSDNDGTAQKWRLIRYNADGKNVDVNTAWDSCHSYPMPSPLPSYHSLLVILIILV